MIGIIFALVFLGGLAAIIIGLIIIGRRGDNP